MAGGLAALATLALVIGLRRGDADEAGDVPGAPGTIACATEGAGLQYEQFSADHVEPI